MCPRKTGSSSEGGEGTQAQTRLISGRGDGTFAPDANATRAEVAVIVNHMLGRTPDQSFVDRSLDRLVSFSDLNSSHWAFYPIMEASNSHGHIKAGGSEQWTGINN